MKLINKIYKGLWGNKSVEVTEFESEKSNSVILVDSPTVSEIKTELKPFVFDKFGITYFYNKQDLQDEDELIENIWNCIIETHSEQYNRLKNYFNDLKNDNYKFYEKLNYRKSLFNLEVYIREIRDNLIKLHEINDVAFPFTNYVFHDKVFYETIDNGFTIENVDKIINEVKYYLQKYNDFLASKEIDVKDFLNINVKLNDTCIIFQKEQFIIVKVIDYDYYQNYAIAQSLSNNKTYKLTNEKFIIVNKDIDTSITLKLLKE